VKLLVTVVERTRQDELIAVLKRCAVTGYSVIPSVFGAGETGAHFGTRAFPGENVMVLALISRLELDGLKQELDRFEKGLRPGEAFKALALDADSLN
jgi:FAD/FMN-containing dehydrogenase